MKTDDRNFDALLVEALSREEAEIFQRLGKPSVFDLVTDTVRGSMRWLNILGYVFTVVMFGCSSSGWGSSASSGCSAPSTHRRCSDGDWALPSACSPSRP